MKIKDIYGNIHEYCPRCETPFIMNEYIFQCERKFNCLHAIQKHVFDTEERIQFALYLDQYFIVFKQDHSICRNWRLSSLSSDIKLPVLPYNITLEKLQMYLNFQ